MSTQGLPSEAQRPHASCEECAACEPPEDPETPREGVSCLRATDIDELALFSNAYCKRAAAFDLSAAASWTDFAQGADAFVDELFADELFDTGPDSGMRS